MARVRLDAQEARARAVIDGEKAARTPRFVKTAGGAKTLDETALARARVARWAVSAGSRLSSAAPKSSKTAMKHQPARDGRGNYPLDG